MTAKGYLEQVKRYRYSIQALEATINLMREDAAGISAIDYSKDRVQTSPSGSKTELMLERLMEREKEMDLLIAQYKTAIGTITHQITRMETDNSAYIKILYKVYIESKSLKKVAEDLNFSYDWTKHLHCDALDCFAEQYELKILA